MRDGREIGREIGREGGREKNELLLAERKILLILLQPKKTTPRYTNPGFTR